jgi:hypothetical protein
MEPVDSKISKFLIGLKNRCTFMQTISFKYASVLNYSVRDPQ